MSAGTTGRDPRSEPTAAAMMSHAELLERIGLALCANGFDEAVAAPIARTVAACERDGTPSHGLLRLPGFVEAVRSGWADGTVPPVLVSGSASMRVVDARNGFTHLALARERDALLAMARETGCAILLVRDAHHFAALWPDIEDFAREGLVALSCVTSRARLAAWGGGAPVFGTNASAFACPRAGGDPIVWDQAASVMSQGDVLLAAKQGRALPPGVGLDADGRPCDDPAAVLAGGALTPFGGYKGASIAFMVEILAAALTGSPFGIESPPPGSKPSKCGQFLMLIDPGRAGADVGARVETLVAALRSAGSEHLPGLRRYRRRERVLREGIPLSAEALATLERLAAGPGAAAAP